MILILILILEISRHIQIQILINVCCVYWIEGSLESLQREREREREKGFLLYTGRCEVRTPPLIIELKHPSDFRQVAFYILIFI